MEHAIPPGMACSIPMRGFESCTNSTSVLFIDQCKHWSIRYFSFSQEKENACESSRGCQRQKKPTALRFRGLRKRRENCVSAVSFFLSKSDPLRRAPILFFHAAPSERLSSSRREDSNQVRTAHRCCSSTSANTGRYDTSLFRKKKRMHSNPLAASFPDPIMSTVPSYRIH